MKVIASHNKDKEDKEGRIICQERVSWSYSRSFYAGNDVRTENVKASFSNEELIITVPKEASKKIKENNSIPIK